MEKIECKNVNDFLDKTDPWKHNWHGWYFRGQGNACWSLLPAIWRETAETTRLFENFKNKSSEQSAFNQHLIREFEKAKIKLENIASTQRLNIEKWMEYLSERVFKNILEWQEKIRFENYLLSRFYFTANKAKLNVPKDQHSLLRLNPPEYWLENNDHSTLGLSQFIELIGYRDDSPYPGMNPGMTGIVDVIKFSQSLPQHYGLPTRSLDWTSNISKATFFALHQLNSDKKKNEIEDIAIYALKQKFIRPHNHQEGRNSIILNTQHLSFENDFLHAQEAVFSQIMGDYHYWLDGKWLSIEDLLERFPDEHESVELKKITLSSNFAQELMEKLARNGISLSTLMPHFRFVSEEIILDP